MTNVLVIAAHPDDEILGCGATMARHARDGDAVDIVIVAEGATSRDVADPLGEISALRDAARQAAAAVGANEPRFLGLPDNRLDSLPLLDVIKSIETVVDELRPGVVYTHHGGDLNIDHRVVHQAVLTACRPMPDCPITAIYAFEVLSSTEWGVGQSDAFLPNHFVNVENQLFQKLEALRCYETEMRDFPHARSLEAVQALASYRGASAGVPAAEAFLLVRERRL
ncbi:MAG: PIG-L family deacetylase [Rhodospirillaceae bacterium]|jgi:N-acetylglucosamine malate deacetylase 1|nr:PIG-L family deacetylase [Rhodospirillaceae bacterium]MBT6428741.1 PIG-L family deacetylase [Rhodospirillaceae bacterium]